MKPVSGIVNNFFSPAASYPVSVDLLVSGTVPVGCELSSSAVIVVASILAFLAASNKLEGATKRMLVDMQ